MYVKYPLSLRNVEDLRMQKPVRRDKVRDASTPIVPKAPYPRLLTKRCICSDNAHREAVSFT